MHLCLYHTERIKCVLSHFKVMQNSLKFLLYSNSEMELKPTYQPSHGPRWFLWLSCARLQKGTSPLLLLAHWYSWPNLLAFWLASLCLWDLQTWENPEIAQYKKSWHYFLVTNTVTFWILKYIRAFLINIVMPSKKKNSAYRATEIDPAFSN